MNNFFNIRAMAGTIVLEIFGEFTQWDMFEEYLRWQIKEFGEDAPLTVRCSSPGGDPRVGIALYGIIRDHKGPTTGIIEYMCDSSATLPMCACDTVIGNSFPFEYMIHDPKLAMDWSTVEEGQSMIDYLAQVRDNMANIYVAKTGQDEATIRQWMSETKFMKADEALQLGFIDEIKEVDQTLSAKVDTKMAASKHADQRPKNFTIEGRGTSSELSNNKNEKETIMEWLSKVKAAFGLGDSADEADVVLTSKELKAKADKVDVLASEVETKDARIAELEAENEKLKGEQPTEEEIEAAQAAEVDAALEAAVKDFKITAASKQGWADRFAGKPDELKATLELIDKGAVKASNNVQNPKGKTRASVGVHSKVAEHFQTK